MTDDLPDGIVVAATTEVGSAHLAVALENQDVEAIGRALRLDFVVVPLLRSKVGVLETRVFAAADSPAGAPRFNLCLFSSTETFAEFISDISDREFALQRGAALVPFLIQHADFLNAVVFDPAGPHTMSASVADVIAALEPQPGDDEAAWVAGDTHPSEFRSDGDPTLSRVTGFDLPLSGDWFSIALDDAAARDASVKQLVNRQLKGLPAAPVLRRELARWLTETCIRAAAGGAEFMAYLLQRNRTGALALNVVLYWQQLGPAQGGRTHLDSMAKWLSERLAPEAKLLSAVTPAGPLVRHSRVASASADVGTPDLPLLIVDYWIEFPDHRGLCLITFSSPHVDLADTLLTLMDNIVLSGAWELETPMGDADSVAAQQ